MIKDAQWSNASLLFFRCLWQLRPFNISEQLRFGGCSPSYDGQQKMMIFSFFILDCCGPARNVCGVLAEVRRGEWWSSGTWSSTPPPPFSSAQAGPASLEANFSKLMAL